MEPSQSRFSIARGVRFFRPMHRGNGFHYMTGRCPKGMPRGQWETVSRPKWPIWVSVLGVWSACAVLIMVTLDMARTGLQAPRSVLVSMILVGILYSVSLGILWAIPRIRERRFERTVRTVQYEVCLNCGYSLHGLPEAHCCPECGTEYQKDAAREKWKSWFAR